MVLRPVNKIIEILVLVRPFIKWLVTELIIVNYRKLFYCHQGNKSENNKTLPIDQKPVLLQHPSYLILTNDFGRVTVPVIEQIETCEWINQLNYYVKNVVTLIVSVIMAARVWPFRQWNATHFFWWRFVVSQYKLSVIL